MTTETETEFDPTDIDDRFTDTVLDRSHTALPDPVAPLWPPPGEYFLRVGAVEDEFKPEKSGVSERTGKPYHFPAELLLKLNLEIVADAAGSDEYAGCKVNPYYRVSSAPPSYWDKASRAFKPSNFDTLGDVFALFGLDVPDRVSDIVALAQGLTGQTTPRAIYLTRQGDTGKAFSDPRANYKEYFKTQDGISVTLSEKAFRLNPELGGKASAYKAAGGTWAKVGYIFDPDNDPQWTLERPSDNVIHARVFANLEPTPRSWRPQGV